MSLAIAETDTPEVREYKTLMWSKHDAKWQIFMSRSFMIPTPKRESKRGLVLKVSRWSHKYRPLPKG
jgi:hypothetical protein